jgi:hypothetical protein
MAAGRRNGGWASGGSKRTAGRATACRAARMGTRTHCIARRVGQMRCGGRRRAALFSNYLLFMSEVRRLIERVEISEIRMCRDNDLYVVWLRNGPAHPKSYQLTVSSQSYTWPLSRRYREFVHLHREVRPTPSPPLPPPTLPQYPPPHPPPAIRPVQQRPRPPPQALVGRL